MWCHVRLINPENRNAERISKQDINDYAKIEDIFQMQVNNFGYENKVYPLYISKKSYDQTLNLLLITEKDKSHYLFIKDFNRLFSRTKQRLKKTLLYVLFRKF